MFAVEVCPFVLPTLKYSSEGVFYEFYIDNNHDAVEDITFQVWICLLLFPPQMHNN